MCLRRLVEADIPQVADLHWNCMLGRSGPAPPALRSSFQELYFNSPWPESIGRSIVYEDERGITGFAGGLVRRMSANGESIRAGFPGNFVIRPEARSRDTARQMLEYGMEGNQDITQTDSANDLSRRILERAGWRLIPALNVHWVRPLRPSEFAVYVASRASSRRLTSCLRLAAKPFCSIVDHLAGRPAASPFRRNQTSLHTAELNPETLLECLVEFRKGYSLWPEYDAHSLGWLLNFMERRSSRGRLRKVVARNGENRIVGCYIYYVKPGAVGEVVQICGERASMKELLDSLLCDAWSKGVIALHGVAQSDIIADLSDKNCIFTCRGGWALAHSKRPELLEILEQGKAFLSRLDGEWCLNPGD